VPDLPQQTIHTYTRVVPTMSNSLSTNPMGLKAQNLFFCNQSEQNARTEVNKSTLRCGTSDQITSPSQNLSCLKGWR